METKKLIKDMLSEGKTTAKALSRSLGRSDGFVTSTLTKNSVPQLDTFSRMARLLGYDLVLRGHGCERVLNGGDGCEISEPVKIGVPRRRIISIEEVVSEPDSWAPLDQDGFKL